MSNTALVGTRKGLFTVTLDAWSSSVSEPAFLGSPVTNAVRDPRDGALVRGARSRPLRGAPPSQ